MEPEEFDDGLDVFIDGYRRHHGLPQQIRTRVRARVVEPPVPPSPAMGSGVSASVKSVFVVLTVATVGVATLLAGGTQREDDGATHVTRGQATAAPANAATAQTEQRPPPSASANASRRSVAETTDGDGQEASFAPAAPAFKSQARSDTVAHRPPVAAGRRSPAGPVAKEDGPNGPAEREGGFAPLGETDASTEAATQRELLHEEVVLVRKAQQALRSKHPRRALDAVEQHANHFPHGKLAEPREVAAVRALCELGHADAAARRLADFRRAWPDSPYRTTLETRCEKIAAADDE